MSTLTSIRSDKKRFSHLFKLEAVNLKENESFNKGSEMSIMLNLNPEQEKQATLGNNQKIVRNSVSETRLLSRFQKPDKKEGFSINI
jgi:hypothetical protein